MQQRTILDLDLSKLGQQTEALEPRVWAPECPGLERVGSWGGAALGVSILQAEPGPAPLVLAVGSAVQAGFPTAARLSVLSRSPLHGRFAEGQIGGDLGPRLGHLAEALVLRGRTQIPGAVLFLGPGPCARLESHPELLGQGPAEVWRRLRPRGALMSVGLGGELGLPFAVLAGGDEFPSFVGRGGLGAVFGGLGLKALVIEGELPLPAPPSNPRSLAAQRALAASPRLRERGAGGSLELFGAADDAGLGGRLAREARTRGVRREGCRGCPTPCGWVFERADGKHHKGRFNANRALGQDLGLQDLDASLGLLARCDEYGVDAREVGALLELLLRVQESRGERSLRGDQSGLLDAIDAMHGRHPGWPGFRFEDFKLGVQQLMLQHALDPAELRAGGHASSAQGTRAGLLGSFVSCGGSDPMRSFPFLIDALGHAGLERVCADLDALPTGAEDSDSPVAKGRLVAWHEDLVAAIDAAGFCVFSCAGLLADGIVGLPEIAGWLLPERVASNDAWSRLQPAERLLSMGSAIVEVRRLLDRRYAQQGAVHAATPFESLTLAQRQQLAEPGMLAEYLGCRADLGETRQLAKPRPRWGRVHTPGVPTTAAPQPVVARRPGSVSLELSGFLAQRFGSEAPVLELPLPATYADVLRAAAHAHPELARWLFIGGTQAGVPLPVAWRAGQRLPEGAAVCAGDVLRLVSVIAGG